MTSLLAATRSGLSRIEMWQWEACVVMIVLAASVTVSGGEPKEWIGAAAVFFAFMHAQVADHLADAQEKRPVADVTCWPWLNRYFWIKEILWLAYFIISQTWAALAGVIIFIAYRFWRRFYKSRIANRMIRT